MKRQFLGVFRVPADYAELPPDEKRVIADNIARSIRAKLVQLDSGYATDVDAAEDEE